ncbi:hypothetical protein MUU74_07710 [Chryseobacterium daecheongense]|uniref:hypothetical protein n=1 Tax=Chryseobacterium daecheongense TaxID=192389 RepID=UPI001FD6AFD9|nr:hypothetical protein [Chryseobacterium daecheongense]UOU99826.1 hypothetical protein MUU74_07710 [Chryseobacterium daecheongense]
MKVPVAGLKSPPAPLPKSTVSTQPFMKVEVAVGILCTELLLAFTNALVGAVRGNAIHCSPSEYSKKPPVLYRIAPAPAWDGL